MFSCENLKVFLGLLLYIIACTSALYVKYHPKPESKNCGYESCHPSKEGYINVHLIPHSHDDVGWVKTVDQFYYGTQSVIYRAGVQYIYDNVLKSVQKNKNRRFIYVETAFFWKWWLNQDEREREILRQLVNDGQIEFTGGGWSMNDEAVTNYQSVIDQMSWGLKKLNDSFGECGRPKMGWQIDPFGHSSEMASIFSQLGYDGVILGRIDHQDKDARLASKSMDMVWRGSNNLGRKSDIFTSVLYNHYDAPSGFCFDILCNDEPLVDDPDSPEYNIDLKAETFISLIQDAPRSFQTNNIIVPMGRDFAYQEAEIWFKNIDILIKYINTQEVFNNTKYHLLYSTPSCYVASVQKESMGILSSPLKTDDFFPYASGPEEYWTGYYTSRPTLKRYERIGNNFLQICKQLYALTNLSPEFEPKLDSLRDAMGIMQHHDAVTGTEKEVVAYDYARIMHMGFKNCDQLAGQALSKLTNVKASKFETCLLTNVSQCALTEKHDTFVVTVYNPLSRPVRKYVRLPVLGTSYTVTDPDGKHVAVQLLPIASSVTKIAGRKSEATLELIFDAEEVPPLGFKSFYVQQKEGNDVTQEYLDLYFHYPNQKGVAIDINPATGLLQKIEMNGIKLDMEQKFWSYNGSNSFTDWTHRASGAYIFNPDNDVPIELVSETAAFEVYRGNLVTEVHQRFTDYASQVIRLYENENYIEFDWVVGPLGMENSTNGREIISRFTTPLQNEATFYTDSNGREMMKRVRSYRPTWDLNTNETESSNYYPVTSKISIQDRKRNLQFAVMTDRSEGGASLEDGQIELMLLRNSYTDDALGVGEPLMETAFDKPLIVRGSHFVTLGLIRNKTSTEQSVSAVEHEITSQKVLDSWIFLSVPNEKTFSAYKNAHKMKFSGLIKSLPKNVQIMTLEPWKKSSYLLRLEHIFEKNLDPVLSEPATVNLKNLFSTFEIKSIRETTLGGNQWLKDNQRLKFKSAYQSDDLNYHDIYDYDSDNDFVVKLEPMEIKTFIIEVRFESA